MDLDTLILNSQQFEEESGLFEQSLLDYYNAIDRKHIRLKQGLESATPDLDQRMLKTFQPYNGFMHGYRDLVTPDLFMEFGYDLLN